ncbi:MAG: hypothetical protein IKU22_06340, partial [Alistipes sp.]|nr:hypothetical protein [Alistipes sp.]
FLLRTKLNRKNQNSKFNAAFKRGQCKKIFYLAERSSEKPPLRWVKIQNSKLFTLTQKFSSTTEY